MFIYYLFPAILDDGTSLSHGSGQHHIDRGSHRDLIHVHMAAPQMLRIRDHHPILHVRPRTQCVKALLVEINGPASNVAAAGTPGGCIISADSTPVPLIFHREPNLNSRVFQKVPKRQKNT
jgi:hypothetical protein